MLSRSKSTLLAICLAFVASTSVAQFTTVGSGACVDSSGFSYDSLTAAGVSSTTGCQQACTSISTTNLRGIEYSTSCLCLYENGAGVPANAFAEIGSEPGTGAVAGANSTFATFTCYSFNGGSWSSRGTGGCVDARQQFYSYGVPFNARGSQPVGTCQNACRAAGTTGLVGLDYDGECYCLYNAPNAPSRTFTSAVSSNSGSGAIGRTNAGSGTCQRFGALPTTPPTAVPVAAPIAVPTAAVPVSIPTTVTTPTTPSTPTATTAKAPRVKGAGKKTAAKAPGGNKGTKLVASPVAPVASPAKAPRNPKRRLKVFQ